MANIIGTAGDDKLRGKAQDDSIIGAAGNDYIKGSSGDDTLDGGADNDTIKGGSGNDLIIGGEGDNEIDGGSRNDTITAGAGNDIIDGGAHDDSIDAGDGDNEVDGGSGNDSITTGDGNDSVDGGAGSDIIMTGRGRDLIDGASGSDTIESGGGRDTIDGGSGSDTIRAGGGRDEVNGGSGSDNINGQGGRDLLNGDSGNDTINGARGDDTIIGGKGDDELTGGKGEDLFIFDEGSGVDTITDFNPDEDTVELQGIDEADTALEFDGTNTLLKVEGETKVVFEDIDLTSTISTPFFQGFEDDTAGWLDGTNEWEGLADRVASGTDGITSAEGDFHAIFTQDNSGPFTRFDGYRDSFPGEWKASADIYLDTSWDAGEGFDYSVASNGSDGGHQRDFIFHVTKDTSTGDLLVGGSNNTNFDPREDLENINNYEVTESGWFTFEHVFSNDGGQLSVDLNLYNNAGDLLFTETRTNPADTIPDEVGGNRYGWFTNIDIDGGIAVDNTQLTIDSGAIDTSWLTFA